MRWLPSPFLSALLFGVWLLLNQSVSAGHLVLGLVFAVSIPLATAGVQGPTPRIKRPAVALRLFGHFLWDILVSNLEVLRRSLGPETALRPGFVWVPLALSEPRAIAVLSSMITLTPGTLTADLSEDRRHLLVHALHVDDAAALVAGIKSRYEAPLREIFE
mgnify:CR=1 FL=1